LPGALLDLLAVRVHATRPYDFVQFPNKITDRRSKTRRRNQKMFGEW